MFEILQIFAIHSTVTSENINIGTTRLGAIVLILLPISGKLLFLEIILQCVNIAGISKRKFYILGYSKLK